MSAALNILSIDGGGIRGIIPAKVLAELERRTGRRTAELFDLIAGTSTGGILAVALTVREPGGQALRWTAEELVHLYVDEGPDIFSRTLLRKVSTALGLLDERYDAGPLEAALERYVGDARLSELVTDVLITAYDMEGRAPFLFKSHVADERPAWDHLAREAARATAAAPTYFEPLLLEAGGERYSLVDGGVYATNPSMLAFVEAQRIAPGRPVRIVSLGTGELTRRFRHEDVRGWGLVEWVRPLIDVVFDGVADVTTTQLDELLGAEHHRFQVELTEASDDLDDASWENLAELQGHADELIERESARLDALAEALGSE